MTGLPFEIESFRSQYVIERPTIIRFALIAGIFTSLFATLAMAQQPGITLYDPEPEHLWNRIHSAIFLRTSKDGKEFGRDALDPLLWSNSSYLLQQPLHGKLIGLLDDFIAQHAESLSADPLKRAVLQHDLWAVFDWASLSKTPSAKQQALQSRLGKIIQRLALTREEIAVLPDNYSAAVASKTFAAAFDAKQPDLPFLPEDLLKKDGSWMAFGTEVAAAAPTYTQEAGARSAFTVLVRLPTGRADSKAYIQRLNSNPTPYVRSSGNNPDGTPKIILNPNLPQFPAGTQFAVVRHMLLIDRNGTLRTSPIVEEVRMRVHQTSVSFFDFRMQRDKLLNKQDGGLRAVSKEEIEYPLSSQSDQVDLLESTNTQPRSILQSCAACHTGSNLTAFLSYNRPYTALTPRPAVLADRSEWDQMGAWTTLSAKYADDRWVALKRVWVDPSDK